MKIVYLLIVILSFSSNSYAQSPCPTPTITGVLKYDNAQSTPLNAAKVYIKTIAGYILDSAVTDINGAYYFCYISNGDYILSAKTSLPWGGVNTADALIVAHHFVEYLTLDGIRYKAGDINANSYINSTDGLGILKRFLELSSSFPIGDWTFEEPHITIADSITQIVDIKGLCTGDLNGSYIPFNQPFVTCGDTFIDQRDNQKYPTVQIFTQCWMSKNINVGTMVISTMSSSPHSDCFDNNIIEKYCYNNDTAMCSIYGGLYDWDEMMQYDTIPGIKGICPEGWHIPSDSEWCLMTSSIDPTVNCSVNGGYTGTNVGGLLKEPGNFHWNLPNTGANNQYGFTALAAGGRSMNGLIATLKETAGFWTSSLGTSTRPYGWGVFFNLKSVSHTSNLVKNLAESVRCIKD